MNEVHNFCTIWDNVQTPIGVLYIIESDENHTANEFIKTMNQYGYIAIISRNHHNRILGKICARYKLPVIVIGRNENCHTVREMVAREDLCKAGICLAADTFRPRIIGWIKSLWRMHDADKPMLEISCGNNALRMGCTMAQNLYRNHRYQNIHKTTFVIYPDIHAQFDAPEIQRDTLEFLREIRWQ